MLVLAHPREAPAQVHADSAQRLDTLAAQENQKGTRGGYERALELWTEAATLYRRGANQRSEGRVLVEIGRVHWALSLRDTVVTQVRSREASALTSFYQALEIARRDTSHAFRGRAFAYIGAFYANTNHPDSGFVYLSQSLPELDAAGERKLQARTLVQLGHIYSNIHVDSALVYYKRALHIQRELSDTSEEALTLGTIAGPYQLAYLPDSAIAYYRGAVARYGAMGDLAHESGMLNSIALVHQGVGRSDSAMAYYRRALAVVRNGPHPTAGREALKAEGEALRGLGTMHIRAARYDSAFTNLKLALASYQKAGELFDEGMTYGQISGLYWELGRGDSGFVYSTKRDSLQAAYMKAVNARSGALASAMKALNARSGALDSAMKALTAAPGAAASGGRALGPAAAPNDSPVSKLGKAHQDLVQWRARGWRLMESALLTEIAGIHQDLGNLDSVNLYYHQALALARHGNDPDREASSLFSLGFFNEKQARPDSALTYYLQALERHRETGSRSSERVELWVIGTVHHRRSDRPNLRAALAYYDSASTVYAAGAAHAGGDANRVSMTEQTTGLSENWALAWLARAKEVGTLPSAVAALAVAERGRAQGLLDLMRRSASEAAGTRGVSAGLTQPGADLGAEAEALLAPLRRAHTAALTYLVTPDTLILWLLSPSGALKVHERAVTRDSLVKLVQSLRAGLGADAARGQMARGADHQPLEQERGVRVRRATRETFDSAANRLGALLLPADFLALLPAGTELVLLPHDVLGLVPFAALPISKNELLGVRYALRYAPSLAALNAAEAGPSLARGPGRAALFRQAMVVGNPTMPTVRDTLGEPAQLNPLPGAEEEARAIATRLKTTALTGPAATKGAVLARLNTAPLIHLATHGLAYGSDALVRSSYVALAPDANHVGGLFTLGELLDDSALRIQAELVVLSACQTGLGDMKQAEGTVGFQRAYLAKGARSVLVSLWSVDDRATRMLMEQFYSHWLDDQDQPSKAVALLRAQTDVRTSKEFKFADPRYWAAFQLVGAR